MIILNRLHNMLQTKSLSRLQIKPSLLHKPTLRCTEQIVMYSKVPRGFKNAKKEKDLGFIKYVFLIFPATTFCLGVWQYNRRKWKIQMIEELDYKVKKSPPLEFPSSLSEISEEEYTKYKLKGQFQNSQEVLIGPRSLLSEEGGTRGFGLISSGEKVGYHVVTPFQVENGPRILINRGWVPRTHIDKSSRTNGQIEGLVEIVGVTRHDEETLAMTPQNKVDSDTWYSRDITALAKKLDTEMVYLDLDLRSSVFAAERGGPLGGQTRISLRNDHVQYMLTWWGASLASTLLWYKKFFR